MQSFQSQHVRLSHSKNAEKFTCLKMMKCWNVNIWKTFQWKLAVPVTKMTQKRLLSPTGNGSLEKRNRSTETVRNFQKCPKCVRNFQKSPMLSQKYPEISKLESENSKIFLFRERSPFPWYLALQSEFCWPRVLCVFTIATVDSWCLSESGMDVWWTYGRE